MLKNDLKKRYASHKKMNPRAIWVLTEKLEFEISQSWFLKKGLGSSLIFWAGIYLLDDPRLIQKKINKSLVTLNKPFSSKLANWFVLVITSHYIMGGFSWSSLMPKKWWSVGDVTVRIFFRLLLSCQKKNCPGLLYLICQAAVYFQCNWGFIFSDSNFSKHYIWKEVSRPSVTSRKESLFLAWRDNWMSPFFLRGEGLEGVGVTVEKPNGILKGKKYTLSGKRWKRVKAWNFLGESD